MGGEYIPTSPPRARQNISEVEDVTQWVHGELWNISRQFDPISEFKLAGETSSTHNLIIDGGMWLWPEKTTEAGATDTYTSSMTRVVAQGAADITWSRVSGERALYSVNVKDTNGVASPAAGDLLTVQWPIHWLELYSVRPGSTNRVPTTLAFDFKTPVTGTYCVFVHNHDRDLTFVKEFVVSTADETKEYKIPIKFPTTDSGSHWLTSSAEWGAHVGITLMAGTNFNGGTNNSFVDEANVHYATTNQVNAFPTVNAGVTVGNVRFYLGEEIPHIAPGGQDEVGRFQSVYKSSYQGEGDYPGKASTDEGRVVVRADNGGSVYHSVNFDTKTRFTPSAVTIYSPATGTSGKIRDITGSVDINVTVESTLSKSAFDISATGATEVDWAGTNARLSYHYLLDLRATT